MKRLRATRMGQEQALIQLANHHVFMPLCLRHRHGHWTLKEKER